MAYKCIPFSGGIDVSVNESNYFTFRAQTHNLLNTGNGNVRVQRKIDTLFELLDTPITDFVDVAGNVIANTFDQLSTYFYADRVVMAGEGVSVVNGKVSLLAGGPSTLGGFKVGTGLTVDGSGRLSASATSEITRVLNNEAEMLALPVEELRSYRVIRLDTKRLYYTNAGATPSVLGNWFVGPSIEAAVLSFNGRTGAVEPEFGDYNFDLVTAVDKTTANTYKLIVDAGKLYIQNATTLTRVEISYADDMKDVTSRITALEDLVSSPTGLVSKVEVLDGKVAANTNLISNSQTGLVVRVKALEEKPDNSKDFTPEIEALQRKDASQDILINSANVKADSVASNNVVLDTRVTTLENKPYATQIKALQDKDVVRDAKFVAIDSALVNKAPLVAGKVPYDNLPEFPVGRKLNVANQAARYALSKYFDLTIAYQSDTGDAWGLDANADPAISSNWSKLGNSQGIGVASFNGRTGQIAPMAGDYDAGKIAELVDKRFVSTAQIAKWDASSDAAGVTTFKGRSGAVIPTSGDYTADLITETTTRKFVTNEQITSWNGKETTTGSQAKADIVKTYADTTFLTKVQRGVNNGVAPLDATGKVPLINLPVVTPRIWRNVKANKTVGAWTTNTSGNEMVVYIRSEQTTNAQRWIQGVIRKDANDSTGLTFQSDATAATSNRRESLTLHVPAGWQYIIVTDGGTSIAATQYWYEMS